MRLILEGVGVGIAAGLSVGAFRYLLAVSGAFRQGLCEAVSIAAAQGRWLWPILYMSAFFIIAWLLAKIVAREPMCTGSGIPQVKGVLMGKMSMNWASVLVAKIAGGVLAIGAGMSLGREGPSVQLGACAGQGIGHLSQSFHRGLEARKLLVAGAGAGLAAAFNAPLAGVIFGLEELQRTFSAAALLVSITAAVTATAVTGLFFGSSPVFSLGYLLPMPLDMLGWLAGLGLFVGTLGRMFNPSLLWAQDFYERLGLKGMYKPLLPLLLAACLGFVLPEILGGGSHLVDALAVESYSLAFLCLLFAGKFLFTMLCFGSGVPGGIFLPMLVLGALGGAIFGNLLAGAGLFPAMYLPDMIVFGMAAYFAVVAKSPVTGSVLIMEMTGSFQHMLALLIVSLSAYAVSDLTGGRPVYVQLLGRMLRKNKGKEKKNLQELTK
ncbi:MAG: ClC family H(+)/Cl(-) exchange transporter [Anaerovibrio sp.]|uniref:ClC family H(+)/Cl(-) exchange transporter n=1 Tax=Anaerovibrio sp. TaxID=1872532 RepID=UPI00261FED1F|nr:ClC family H(+)/Cl(-) exchange transporter [Anaerovibrio sp.]MDD7677763.1 ClC family H(+)/Cl(-) exchange transporter [Anaerovibrio sp.]MDY2604404.1 ClC family H(+)/Cl(-) exchange transporter [Anaerovibrio sp.]